MQKENSSIRWWKKINQIFFESFLDKVNQLKEAKGAMQQRGPQTIKEPLPGNLNLFFVYLCFCFNSSVIMLSEFLYFMLQFLLFYKPCFPHVSLTISYS